MSPAGCSCSLARSSSSAPCATRVRTRPRSVLIRVAPSKGGFAGVGHLDPFRVRRGLSLVVVVPVPPLIRWGLRVTLGRVLPRLLTPKRRHVEIAPGSAHRLVATFVDEVGAEHALAVAD